MFNLPLHPLSVVLLDSVRSVFPRFLPSSSAVPVYIMLPLDSALPSCPVDLPSAFAKLKDIGVAGIMVDVWWGLCEPDPSVYEFTAYKSLFEQVKQAGLKIQATLSFHACGGNVGDSVDIPLPEWVRKVCDEKGMWFTDRHGWENREYISLGADHERVQPGSKGLRTPVEAYGEFVKAFVKEFDGLMGECIVEVQMGLGPAGELRYPGYPMPKWEFPGIGEFQCFDRYLQQEMKDKGCEVEGFGGYNDRPWDCEFFKKGYRRKEGKKFLDWYFERMIKHAEDVLGEVRDVVKVKIAVKISGIHWWKLTKCRAAEATSGYMKGGSSGYADIAKVLKKFDAVLCFTCLEMRTCDQPFLSARCAPSQLVREVFNAAKKEGVSIAGENALEGVGDKGYRQIVKAYRGRGGGTFTLLRLGERLLQEEEMEKLGRFVKEMNKV